MKITFDPRYGIPALAALLLAGCSDVGKQDAEERSLALISKADARQAAGDAGGAIELYNEALMVHPRAARAHLDLALLLHDNRQDLAGAIYHYQRYIEMRPDTEKKDMILSRIRLATQAFGARSLEESQAANRRITELTAENERLKTEIETLRGEVKQLRTPRQVAAQNRRPEPRGSDETSTQNTSGAPRTYRVQRGDTLASIAAEIYGDASQWRRIYEGNKTVIPDSDHVPAGAVLVIP